MTLVVRRRFQWVEGQSKKANSSSRSSSRQATARGAWGGVCGRGGLGGRGRPGRAGHCRRGLRRDWAGHRSRGLAGWGWWGGRWAAGCVHGEACHGLLGWANEEPDCVSGLASLLHGLVPGCQLGEKRPKARGRAWWVAVFVAEVEVEAGPLVIVQPLGGRHPGPFQAPFKGDPCVSGNLLHRKKYGR